MRWTFSVLVCSLAIGLLAGPGATGTMRDTLAVKARREVVHGGVRSSAYGDATERMKLLSARLIVRRFSRAGQDAARWAMCVARRESALNPGAVNSSSGAAGLFQFLGHPQYSTWRLLHDPAYAVDAAWSLSHGGRDRSPWQGGGYAC